MAAAELSRGAQRVYDDYRSDAAIQPCDHSVKVYRRTLREITPDIEEETPAFRPAVEAALRERERGGDCAAPGDEQQDEDGGAGPRRVAAGRRPPRPARAPPAGAREARRPPSPRRPAPAHEGAAAAPAATPTPTVAPAAAGGRAPRPRRRARPCCSTGPTRARRSGC